jgi:hypothetical protein
MQVEVIQAGEHFPDGCGMGQFARTDTRARID